MAVFALVLAGASLMLMASPASAGHGDGPIIVDDDETSGTYSKTITAAIQHANPGDVIEVKAGTYDEALTVETNSTGALLEDLTLKGYPGDTTSDTEPEAVIVNATGISTTVVDILAPRVTMETFTLVWDGDPSQVSSDVRGVDVQADGATLDDLTIQLPGGFCSTEYECPSPNGQGIVAQESTTVVDTRIETDYYDTGDLSTAGGTHGVFVATNDQVTIRRGSIAGFGMGVNTHGSNTLVDGVTFETNVRGVQIASDGVELQHNDFTSNQNATYVTGSHTDITLRSNDIDLTNSQALSFASNETTAEVDARLNDWGVVKEELIENSRVTNEGTNEALLVPYHDAGDNQIPPQPTVKCYFDDSGETTEVAKTVTLQEAVDLTLGPICQDADGDGAVERVIVLEPSFEEYNEAVIDTPVELTSNVTADLDDSTEATQGALDFGARIHAHTDQPGLTFVDGSQNSHVEGLGIQGEPVGTTAVLAESISGDSGITLEDVGIGSRSNDATNGIVLRQVDGFTVTSSTILSGDPVVTLENTANTTIDNSRISFRAPANAGQQVDPGATGILVSGADSPTISNSTVIGNAAEESVAIDVRQTSTPTIEDNVVVNAVDGLRLEASTAADVTDNTFAFPALDVFSGDNAGIETVGGADHTIERNTIQNADVGLNIDATPGVEGDLNRINGTTTGVQIANLAEDQRDPGNETVFNNGTLATTLYPMVLTESTANLDVNAECNDWGVYQQDLVDQRVSDEDGSNDVDTQPFTSPNSDESTDEIDCLVPPKAEYSFAPESPVTRLDEIDFTDESEEGSYPIVEHQWDFDDGNESAEQNPSHSYDSVGTFFVELAVTDAASMTSSKVHKVQVENILPTFAGLPDNFEIQHTSDVAFQAEVTNMDTQNAEGDNVTLSAYLMEDGEKKALPAGASFEDHGDGTGTFDWDPTSTQYGDYDIRIEADDGYDTEHQTTTITVINNPPTFDPELPAVEGGVEEQPVEIFVNAEDPDDGDSVTELYANLADPALSNNASFDLDESTMSGTFNWTPAPGENGTYIVKFVAESPGRDISVDVELDIRESNAPPTITISGDEIVRDGIRTNLTATADDAENDTINWTVTTDPVVEQDQLAITENTTEAEWIWDIPPGTNGTYNVTFVADDDYGAPVLANETITVEARPYIDALLPREVETDRPTLEPLNGSTVEFAFWAEDPDGELTATDIDVELGYPDGTEMLQPTLKDPDATEPRQWTVQTEMNTTGPHYVNISANDTDGYETFDNTSFEVKPNLPPNATLEQDEIWANATTPFGTTVTLSGDAVDPEGRELTEENFEWHLPGSTTLEGREVSASLPIGTHIVELEVSDPFGESDSEFAVVKIDDTISADGELNAADRGDYYHVDLTENALEDLEGQATVTDDLGNGVGGAFVSGTVTYYGVEANSQGVTVTSFETYSNADGVATFSFDQDLLGAINGPTVLSAPGWHEITLDVDAPSRTTAPLQDQETTEETILYFVGPEAPAEGPASSVGPIAEDDTPPAPVFALGQLVEACGEESAVQVTAAECPTAEEGLFAAPQLPEIQLAQTLAADMAAQGACFHEDGTDANVEATYGGGGLAVSEAGLTQVQEVLAACAEGLTDGHLPQGSSYVAVTGTDGSQALVLTVEVVPGTNAATGELGPKALAQQIACMGDARAADEGEFLGPPAPESSAPEVSHVNAALTPCAPAAEDDATAEDTEEERFTATVAGSTVAVSVDTLDPSAALS